MRQICWVNKQDASVILCDIVPFRSDVGVATLSLTMALRQLMQCLAVLMLLSGRIKAELIVLITDHNGAIYKIDSNGQNMLYDDQEGTEDIAYDPVEEQVYWSNLDTHSVSRIDLDGRNYVKLFDIEKCQGLVLDPTSRILFYSDDKTAIIGKYYLETSVKEVIVRSDLTRPHALAADARRRKLYWSDIGVDPKLEMADYDGDDRETLERSSLIWPTSLALDKTGDNLFWVDEHGSLNDVKALDLSTRTTRSITYRGFQREFFDIDLCNDMLYLIDRERASVYLSMPITGGRLITTSIPGGMSMYRHIRVFNHPQECPPGRHGKECQLPCGRCRDDTPCMRDTGYCPSGCRPGWTGNMCTEECMDGYFGINCKDSCGHCKGETACDKSNGQCASGCERGWVGYNCAQECTEGYFGVNCTEMCGHCLSGAACDKADGRCSTGCDGGWFGFTCTKECVDGYFGVNCNESCGKCKDDHPCDTKDGRCLFGCETGWIGNNCTQATPASGTHSEFNLVPVVIGVCVAAAVVFVVLALGIYTCRKSSAPRQGQGTVAYRTVKNR
ncbi:pro-epidermal growth factor-like isoform X3 [Haliotis asinina]|uniref:pro-epidermal growth factor-like isoform X3 n=1 Tax=Haliotis asinina TaxID=109174 RepID=UPI0035321C2B